MSVTRGTADTYNVRAGGEFATIAIRCWSRESAQEKRILFGGKILIHFSFGSWAHSWNHCGEPFRTFLVTADRDYLFGKFCPSALRVYDGETTAANIRDRLLARRRENALSALTARMIFDRLRQHRDAIEDSLTRMVEALEQIAEELRDRKGVRSFLTEPWEMEVKRINPQIDGFWRILWVEFREALRSELAGEAVAA